LPAPKDLIHETSTTTGTGNFTLSAVSGKIRFSDATYGFSTGGSNVFDYYISNRDASEWERGTGSMSDANTLVRNTVIKSSNSNNAVSFSAGTKDVTNDVPADNQVFNDNSTVTDAHAVVFDGTTGRIIGSAGAKPMLAGKHTLWIPAGTMISATTSGPSVSAVESDTNDNNYRTLDFDASADEHAHFQVAFPKSWNEGTVTFQVWWTSVGAVTSGVAWGLQGVAFSDSDAIDTAMGTPVVVTDDALGTANDVYVSAESSAVTIGGTPAADDVIYFRIFRDISDANDDMTQDARLIGIKIFFTTDAGNDA
jgi:hypothetical protein